MRRLGWLRVPLVACCAFLYLPIVVLVVMSFNDGGSAYSWTGASLRWYRELVADHRLMQALGNTLIVATSATGIATILGALLAIGLKRHTRSVALAAFAMAPALMPDLVLAIGLLALFTMVPLTLGLLTVTLAHSVFGMAFVVAIVRSRLAQLDGSLEEASRDLGAGAATTLLRITLPSIAPAAIAGALLTFTLSVDEFVIAFFTDGPRTPTLPIEIYSRVRFGLTPEINALAAVLLLVSILVVVIAARTTRVAKEIDD